MKRRQILTLWSAVPGVWGMRFAPEVPPVGKESTRSEVSECARASESDESKRTGSRIEPRRT